MTMPEAAVHEDRGLMFRKDQIRAAREFLRVKALPRNLRLWPHRDTLVLVL